MCQNMGGSAVKELITLTRRVSQLDMGMAIFLDWSFFLIVKSLHLFNIIITIINTIESSSCLGLGYVNTSNNRGKPVAARLS